jgi:hypothetical protein
MTDTKLALLISKETYDLLSELVAVGITMLVEKKYRTEAEVSALAELNKVRKELNEWAEEHNNKVLDEKLREAK